MIDFLQKDSTPHYQNASLLHTRFFLEQSEGIKEQEAEFWLIMAQWGGRSRLGESDLKLKPTFSLNPDVLSKEMKAASFMLAFERPLLSGISTRNTRILCSAQKSDTLGQATMLKILRGMGPMFIEDTCNQADFLKLVRNIVTTSSTSTLRHAGLILLGRYLDTVVNFDSCDPNFKAVLTRMLDCTLSVRLECIKIIKKIMFVGSGDGIAAQPELKGLALIRKKVLISVGEALSQKISGEEKAQYVSVFSEAWFQDLNDRDRFSTCEKLDEMIDVLKMLKNCQLDVKGIFGTASLATFQSYTTLLFCRVQGPTYSLAGMSSLYELMLIFARSNPSGFKEHILTLIPVFSTLEQLSLQGQRDSAEYLWLVVDVLGEVLSAIDYRPADLEETILSSCTSGALKFTDRRRCSNMEEIHKAIRLFSCLRNEKANNLLKVILSNSIAFLRTSLDCPSETTSTWGTELIFIFYCC